MKENHTDITIILDRSGSMGSIRQDTIGGFNSFLEDQKKVEGTANFSLYQFDDVLENPVPSQDIQSVSALTLETFVPRGGTALLDAIGQVITKTGDRLKSLPEEQRPERVMVVITTDGEENSSRQFTYDKVNEMITHQREKYQWQFVFLGANQDAIAAASKMGIHGSAAMTTAANAAGTQAMYASLSVNMTCARGPAGPQGPPGPIGFGGEDRLKQQEAGAVQ